MPDLPRGEEPDFDGFPLHFPPDAADLEASDYVLLMTTILRMSVSLVSEAEYGSERAYLISGVVASSLRYLLETGTARAVISDYVMSVFDSSRRLEGRQAQIAVRATLKDLLGATVADAFFKSDLRDGDDGEGGALVALAP